MKYTTWTKFKTPQLWNVTLNEPPDKDNKRNWPYPYTRKVGVVSQHIEEAVTLAQEKYPTAAVMSVQHIGNIDIISEEALKLINEN